MEDLAAQKGDRLLTVRDVAALLGVPEKNVYNLGIPTVRVGKRVRFRRPDLDRWIEERIAPAKERTE